MPLLIKLIAALLPQDPQFIVGLVAVGKRSLAPAARPDIAACRATRDCVLSPKLSAMAATF
jgi:hypothetical protein